ncbi:MAG: methylated-DNA--[protein]-cysteine S-methyltransferase [Methylophilaceae bacterium]
MANKNKLPLQFDAVVKAPFGAVGISVQGMQVAIELLSKKYKPRAAEQKLAKEVASQIEAYFADSYHYFNLPLIFKGTSFQRRVWQVISAIPSGRVVTYGEIAQELDTGPRAVANACGANSLPLVVPCHRVVAKKSLGGFMHGDPSGPAIKKWLLKHEGVDV